MGSGLSRSSAVSDMTKPGVQKPHCSPWHSRTRLHRRQRAVGRGDALDGGDFRAVRLHREHQARSHGGTVHEHRAGAARPVFTAEMGAGESAFVPQEIRQRHAGSTLAAMGVPLTDNRTGFSCIARPASWVAWIQARAVMAAPTFLRYDGDPCRSDGTSSSPVIAAWPISSGDTSLTVFPTTASSAAVARLGVEPSPSSPIAQRDTRSWPSLSSSWTATRAPAIA